MNRARKLLGLAVGLALSAAPANAAQWRLAQPAAPDPPAGVAPAPFPVPLGTLGDLQFQAPNRGILATSGTGSEFGKEGISGKNGFIKEGLYRWDGARWTSFADVCSGKAATPRIVWAGPRDFWTIAYPAAESRTTTEPGPLTLCHFVNGAFIASFATPKTAPNPYLSMAGGACNGPDDCWFGGQVYEDKPGAFHLHWDGTKMTIVNGPQGRPVRDLAAFRGKFYEVTTVSGEAASPLLTTDEDDLAPVLIHELSTGADGASTIKNDPFQAADYPDGVGPDDIDDFTGDPIVVFDVPELTALDAAGNDVLWAGGGQTTTGPGLDFIEARFARGPVLAAKVQDAPFKEVPLTDPRLNRRSLRVIDIAALPDRTAWLAISDNSVSTGAVVAHVDLTGKVLDYAVLPTDDDPDPNTSVSKLGKAERIDCTGVDQCWLATNGGNQETSGWLYRLGDGTGIDVDDDPYFKTFIATRPADATTVADTSDAIPVDNSGDDLPPLLPQYLPVPDPTPAPVVTPPRARNVKVKTVGRTRIVITFTLTAKAKVKIRLTRGKAVVAQSKRAILAPGKKSFTFPVSPRRWPTGIKLDVDQP